MPIRVHREKKRRSGALSGGCALWLVALAIWGICLLIFPKLPAYDETLEKGERLDGEVVRVETVENISINNRHPSRVVYGYGDGKQASMIMALDEAVAERRPLKVRVMGEHAYPEGIRPLARPKWLTAVVIAAAAFGSVLLVGGVLRLLVIGGVLFAGGRALLKKDDGSPPPPPSDPPPPPR